MIKQKYVIQIKIIVKDMKTGEQNKIEISNINSFFK